MTLIQSNRLSNLYLILEVHKKEERILAIMTLHSIWDHFRTVNMIRMEEEKDY
jgi:hypothetical protein